MEAPTTKEDDVDDREDKVKEMCRYVLYAWRSNDADAASIMNSLDAAAAIAHELYPKGVDDAGQGQLGHQPQVGDKAPDR